MVKLSKLTWKKDVEKELRDRNITISDCLDKERWAELIRETPKQNVKPLKLPVNRRRQLDISERSGRGEAEAKYEKSS